MAKDRVEVEILAEVKQAVSGVKDFLGAITTLTAAFGTATKFYKAAFDEFAASERTIKKLEGTLRSTGYSAGYSATQLADMAQELSKITGIDDDVIINAQAVMTTFTKLGRNVFPDAMQAAMDMSAVMGTDLQGAVVQVGKALQDPIQGITALRRVGVNFSEEQKKQIASLIQQNKLFEAQTMILNELKTEFGGVASMMGDTVAGSVDKLKTAWGNWLSAFGKDFATSMRGPMDFFTKLLEKDTAAIERNQAVLQAIEAKRTGAPVADPEKALAGLQTGAWLARLGPEQAELEAFLATYVRYQALGLNAAQQRAQASAAEAARTAELQAQLDKINEAYGKTDAGARASLQAQLKFWESFDLKEWPQNAGKITAIIADLKAQLGDTAALLPVGPMFTDDVEDIDARAEHLRELDKILKAEAASAAKVAEYFNRQKADPYQSQLESGEVNFGANVSFEKPVKDSLEKSRKQFEEMGTYVSGLFEGLGESIAEGSAEGIADAFKQQFVRLLNMLSTYAWAQAAAAMFPLTGLPNPAGAARWAAAAVAASVASGAIAAMAEGGIVNRPTQALIGEAGPEAVIPLDRAGRLGGTTINQYIAGNVMRERYMYEAADRWRRKAYGTH